jgi:hypothetical protein
MTEIQGGKGQVPLSPEEKRALYRDEYKHGAALFQRALDQYVHANSPQQKEEFKEVMQKAMHVLNETAQGLKKSALKEQNEKIQQDWLKYEKEGSQAAEKKLRDDLDEAKNSL